eukprot:c16848_g1_i1.p1 GENE.c16848_g1_i1~~c16848_g1_i1.p1  ORF type:complete len:100 (+),score=10.50 c16848_g1_i1:224-523(+)
MVSSELSFGQVRELPTHRAPLVQLSGSQCAEPARVQWEESISDLCQMFQCRRGSRCTGRVPRTGATVFETTSKNPNNTEFEASGNFKILRLVALQTISR